MSMPLFLIDAPGALLSRGLAVAAGLVPVAVVLARRIARGSWGELPEALRNGAWQPPEGAAPTPAVAHARTGIEVAGRAATFQRALPALGIAGILVWALATPFRADVPALALSRADAERIASAALVSHGIALGPEWQRSSIVRLATDDAARWECHKFVWREGGRDAYAKLIGNVLVPPHWEVRYARFDGDVAEN